MVMDRALVEELVAATKAMAMLVAFLTVTYWVIVDLPVMPFLIGQVLGCALGLGILTLTAPRRQR